MTDLFKSFAEELELRKASPSPTLGSYTHAQRAHEMATHIAADSTSHIKDPEERSAAQAKSYESNKKKYSAKNHEDLESEHTELRPHMAPSTIGKL